MSDPVETRRCPYCSEDIPATANKCERCGKWLEESLKRKGSDLNEKGSAEARAAVDGLKKKAQADFSKGYNGLIVFICAIILGTGAGRIFQSTAVGWIVGIICFGAGLYLVAKDYYRE